MSGVLTVFTHRFGGRPKKSSEHKLTWTIDQVKVEQEERLDGCYVEPVPFKRIFWAAGVSKKI